MTVASIDTQTLIDANQTLSASIHALDAYIAGNAKATKADIQQLADLTGHALMFVGLVAAHSSAPSIDDVAKMTLGQLPELIESLKGAATR
jgi:hypothetical protein